MIYNVFSGMLNPTQSILLTFISLSRVRCVAKEMY